MNPLEQSLITSAKTWRQVWHSYRDYARDQKEPWKSEFNQKAIEALRKAKSNIAAIRDARA